MKMKSSLSVLYQKATVLLFYAMLFVFVMTSILSAAERSMLGLPISEGLIIRMRTIGTVLLILYYLLILPVTSPKKIFIPALCLLAVNWMVSEVSLMLCNLIPETMILGFIGGMFLIGLMGIFVVFVIPTIFSLVSGVFTLFMGLNAILIAACFYLPLAANEGISDKIRKKYQYYGYLLGLFLLLSSGLWYSAAWCGGPYRAGVKAMEAGDNQTAYEMFTLVGSYQDAKDLSNLVGYEAHQQNLADARTAGDEAMAAGDYEKALEIYNSENLTFCSARARAYLARENGDLLSVAEDLKYLFEHDCYDLKDETLELFYDHPEFFTVGDIYYLGTKTDTEGNEVPVRWLIACEDYESFCMFSMDLTEPMQFSEEIVEHYADSDLYYYLNHDYLNSVFSSEEQAMMFKPVDYYNSHPEEYQWPVMIANEDEITMFKDVEGFDRFYEKTQWLRNVTYDIVSKCPVASLLMENGHYNSAPETNRYSARPMIMIYK